MHMQHNLEQQIQACNMSGVSEEALREFSMMFKHFKKDKSSRLDHHEFKSCLQALGYDLLMVEEGQCDPEFEAILDSVDPNRDGMVSLQEYMAFMISQETENVQSSQDVEAAFHALTLGEKPYIFGQEHYANLTKEQADYCIARILHQMKDAVFLSQICSSGGRLVVFKFLSWIVMVVRDQCHLLSWGNYCV